MQLYYPVILDGATGTELQKRGFTGGGCAEAWVLVAVILVVTAIQFWGQKKWVHY